MFDIRVEDIFSKDNMDEAIKRIIRRSRKEKRTEAMEFQKYWEEYGECMIRDIAEGDYQVLPYQCRWIRKQSGIGRRMLSIPGTRDKILQLATALELSKHFDTMFHRCSFGFRKNHSIQQAAEGCIRYANEGRWYVVDLDIEGFFDNIDHLVLQGLLEVNFRDKRIVKWICDIVKAKNCFKGSVYKRKKGVSQGSPLSPLLANIVLNELDWYMEKSGIRFVRYADDILLLDTCYARVKQDLYKVNSYMRKVLNLNINWDKTHFYPLYKTEYLGFEFDSTQGGYQLLIGKVKQEKLLNGIKEYIRKPFGDPVEWWNHIGSYNRGWINFYKKVKKENIIALTKQMDEEEIQAIRKRIDEEFHKKEERGAEMIEGIYTSSFVYNFLWYQKLKEGDNE